MPKNPHINSNTTAWVESAKANPVEYRRRRVTEIVIYSLSFLPEKYASSLLLKGGLLMALAFESKRATQDIDLTAKYKNQVEFSENIKQELDKALARSAELLGYINFEIKVQTLKLRPKSDDFPQASFLELEIKAVFTGHGTISHDRPSRGTVTDIVKLEISFNEPINDRVELLLDRAGKSIFAYSISALIAEKYRALLQQPFKNRYRAQDVYDINFLVRKSEFSLEQKKTILYLLKAAASAKRITATKKSIHAPEVKIRASEEWVRLKNELEEDIPEFEDTFRAVAKFYDSLPW